MLCNYLPQKNINRNKNEIEKHKLSRPLYPHFCPPRIFDTQFASLGMPLDAPVCS